VDIDDIKFRIDYWRQNLAEKRKPATVPQPPTLDGMTQAIFDIGAFRRLLDLEIMLMEAEKI
jgi:hypothetical protein